MDTDKIKTNNKKENKKFFNVMAFPNGPICNLNCEYCYYLDKTEYYVENNDFKMDYELLEDFTKQYIEAQPGPMVNFGWQGGEPTIRGLDFFEKAVELQKKYLPEGWQCQNSFQTNAVLLDDEWCHFFAENNFLIGVSIDGPEWIHDKYRKNKDNGPTHKRVLNGIKLLQEYNIDFNILCVVNDINSKYPVEVYNFFKEIGADFIQFIPIVEINDKGVIGERSVRAEDYGKFLISIFNQWIQNDYGKIYVQIFEEAVRVWAGYNAGLCVFSKTCGDAEVMEHNGDLYSCDHFVYPEYKLGNIKDTPLLDMVSSEKQKKFGNDKFDNLPQQCIDCEVNFICHGGCPKNRVIKTEDADEGLNYLCAGYKQFFNYIDPYMKEVVGRIKKRQSPNFIAKELTKLYNQMWNIGRNEPCPCGSGKKFKKCCINRK